MRLISPLLLFVCLAALVTHGCGGGESPLRSALKNHHGASTGQRGVRVDGDGDGDYGGGGEQGAVVLGGRVGGGRADGVGRGGAAQGGGGGGGGGWEAGGELVGDSVLCPASPSEGMGRDQLDRLLAAASGYPSPARGGRR